MGEFEIIASLFRPLAGPDALDLTDDTAWLADARLVVTKDIIVAGTHFLPGDPAEAIAQKALRVNISDIAAKGAVPERYFLGLVLPRETGADWLEMFAIGLKQDQARYGLTLAGGDTTRHAPPTGKGEGPLMISVTMTGRMPDNREPVLRSGARPGDLLAVTGTIGDAGLGLAIGQRKLSMNIHHEAFLVERYLLPQPRTALAPALAEHGAAALDISDGLIADAGHMATASGVGIEIDLGKLPLSAPARDWLDGQDAQGEALADLAAMGDDYEMLIAAPADAMAVLQTAGEAAGVPVTVIGSCAKAEGRAEVVIRHGGRKLDPARRGYDHFS